MADARKAALASSILQKIKRHGNDQQKIGINRAITQTLAITYNTDFGYGAFSNPTYI